MNSHKNNVNYVLQKNLYMQNDEVFPLGMCRVYFQ